LQSFRSQVRCQYSQEVEERGMVESLWQKLKALERFNRVTEDPTTASPQQILPIPRLQREIHYEVKYPVSKRWYFPMLLHFSRFCNFFPSKTNDTLISDKDSTLWSRALKI
jgi:hypothetical protein